MLFFLFLLKVCAVQAQTFNNRYDLFENDRQQISWGIEQGLPGQYILIQGSWELDSLGPNYFIEHYILGLTAITEEGQKLWDKKLYYPEQSRLPGWANCCDSMPGGGVVVAGSIEDLDDNLMVHLAVFDANGDTVFTRNLGHPGPRWNAFQVKRLQDGGFIITGQTQATGYLDGFALKTDEQGNELWRRTYGQPAPVTDGFLGGLELPGGDLITGGSNFPTPTTHRLWLQRLDPAGEVVWSEYYGLAPTGAATAQLSLTQGHLILLASSKQYALSNSIYAQRPYLALVDPLDGGMIWEKEYGAIAPFHLLYTAKETPTGDIIACGVSEEIGGMQGVLLRTTSEGDSLWMFRYFYQDDVINTGTGQFYDVLPTPDGGFIATGPAYNPLNQQYPPGYSQDAWVVKVDAFGCIIPGCNPVGITEQATNLLDALRIWPNPVAQGGQVHVQLDLPPSVNTKDLELSIVSMDGKVVYRQAVGTVTLSPPKGHPFTLSPSHLSPGLYRLHITNGTTWLTGGKLVVE